jgi:hypothetical protein
MKVLIVLGVVVLLTGGGLAVMNNARAALARGAARCPNCVLLERSCLGYRPILGSEASCRSDSAPYTAARCQSRTDPMPQDRRPELFLPLIP